MNPAGIGNITSPEIPRPGQDGLHGQASESFADLLQESVARVGELQQQADQELRRLLQGEPVELHRVLLAGEKASLAAQLMMSVRNKVVEAYQEVMRMPV